MDRNLFGLYLLAFVNTLLLLLLLFGVSFAG